MQGDLNDVEQMYQRALKNDQNHVDTLNNYGLLLHKTKKDIPAAEEKYRLVDSALAGCMCSAPAGWRLGRVGGWQILPWLACLRLCE